MIGQSLSSTGKKHCKCLSLYRFEIGQVFNGKGRVHFKVHIPVFLCDSSVLGVWTGHQAAVMLDRHTTTRYHAWTLMAVVAVAAMGVVATVGVASEAEVVGEAPLVLVAAAAAGGATLAEASAVVTLVAVASEVVEATMVVTRETRCSSACGCVHSPAEISLGKGTCCNSVDNLTASSAASG